MPAAIGGAPQSGRARRSQADRTATSRVRLIEAAIRCLNRVGYSATTLSLIAAESGMSRGGMLHQFPTKVDLMLAVVAYPTSSEARVGARRRGAYKDKREEFIALTESSWRGHTTAPAMAKLEVLMAARSDPILAAKLPKMFEAIERDRRASVWALAQEAGIRDRDAVDAMVGLHVAAMRGLAIELLVTTDKGRVLKQLELLKKYKNWLVEDLLGERSTGRD